MCGISGFVLRNGKEASEEQITSINNTMIHRGPDASGTFVHNNTALGHRRLKIIDLAGGIQPMHSPDDRYTLVFNGEIYNYLLLQDELTKLGHSFRTNSDTEVILQAWIQWKEACVEKLRGMFAFAIYDRQTGKLFIARDRLGIKPLYYCQTETGFVFSSEVKPILSFMGEKPGVNTSVLDFYLSVGYVPGDQTLFKNILKLPPGHFMTLEGDSVNISEYWNLSYSQNQEIDLNTALEQLDAQMEECMKLHLISDVPVGAFLSGGVDSSAIVAFMNKHADNEVKTFTVGYRDDPKSSELQYAKIVADHFKTEHHEFILDSMDFFDSLDMLLEFTEEPIVESAAVALFQLSKLAKEHVTVILSGEGGDEILAGYPLHQIMPKVDQLNQFGKMVPDFIKPVIGDALPTEKLKKYFDWSVTPMEDRYQSISNDVTHSIKRAMYSGQLLQQHEQTKNYYRDLYLQQASASPLQRMTYSDMKSWLPDDLLIKADKMTMAASLELRVPFLDHEIIEWTATLPDHLRINDGQGKYLLKKLVEKYVPAEIIYRKKQGFPVPISVWFRGKLYKQVESILMDPVTLNRGYFKPDYVAGILQRHKSGKEDLSRRIFTLLALEIWHRKYIDA